MHFIPLVYTVAFGQYLDMARMMIHSVRAFGRPRILILTDSDTTIEGCTVVNVLTHPACQEFENRTNRKLFRSTTDNTVDYLILRAAPHLLADISGITHLIYCDADTLWLDRPETIFPLDETCFCAYREGIVWYRMDSKLKRSLNAHELRKSRRQPYYNAGVFHLPVSMLSLLDEWRRCHLSLAHLNLELSDQEYLNCVLLKHGYPTKHNPRIGRHRGRNGAGIVHYSGDWRVKKRMLDDFRQVFCQDDQTHTTNDTNTRAQ